MKHILFALFILLAVFTVAAPAETIVDYGTELNIVIDPFYPPVQLGTPDPVDEIADYMFFRQCLALRVLANERRKPTCSPDGKWIAITDGQNNSLWIVPSEGGNPVLIDHEYNSEKYAYTWNDENKRWMRSFDMSKLYYYKTGYTNLAFTPDSRKIMYYTSVIDPDRGSIASNGQYYSNFIPTIESIDLYSGERRTVVEEGAAFDISPDGRYLAYCHFDSRIYTDALQAEHNGGLAVLDMITGETRFLNDFDSSMPYDKNRSIWISFSPDGSTIANATSYQIFLIPFEGGEAEQITDFDNGKDEFIAIGTCRYSPDGNYLLVERGGSLVIINIEEKSAFYALTGDVYEQVFSKLFRNSQYMPTWSADGTEIYYVRHDVLKYEANLDFGEYIYHFAFDPAKYTIGKDTPILVETEKPSAFGIAGNYPNPFNPSTTIDFTLDAAAVVSLDIYNAAGQKVRRLLDTSLGTGSHSVVWNGCDDSDSQVSSGVYIARLRSGGKVTSRQMMLMK